MITENYVTTHEYSIERLVHFKCTSCKKWWTIGDWTIVEEIHCPHCGLLGNTKPIEE